MIIPVGEDGVVEPNKEWQLRSEYNNVTWRHTQDTSNPKLARPRLAHYIEFHLAFLLETRLFRWKDRTVLRSERHNTTTARPLNQHTWHPCPVHDHILQCGCPPRTSVHRMGAFLTHPRRATLTHRKSNIRSRPWARL